MKGALFISILLVFCGDIFSQESSQTIRPWAINAQPNYGFIVPHQSSMQHLIQGHSYGVQVGIFRQASGKEYWHQAYNQPEQGVDFCFINTGNPTQLGQQYSISFLLNLPLNRSVEKLQIVQIDKKRKYKHWLGLGLGMGYSTRIWNLETNHQAAVIGSHGNIALTLQYSTRLMRWKDSELRTGFRISHFSNGSFQLPNLGTNNACVFLNFIFKKRETEILPNLVIPAWKKYNVSFAVVGGLKEIPPANGKKYGIGVFSVLGEKRVNYKSSFGLGYEVFYNSSLQVLMHRKLESPVSKGFTVQHGLLFSYTLHFNDFELKLQQGYYMRDNYKLDGLFYHRFGLRYFVNEHLFTQLTLKTHFAKADYGEWGIGWRM